MENNTIYEWCSFCCEDVELPASPGIYKCPSCGELITACSLCDPNEVDCSKCIFNKCLDIWRRHKDE